MQEEELKLTQSTTYQEKDDILSLKNKNRVDILSDWKSEKLTKGKQKTEQLKEERAKKEEEGNITFENDILNAEPITATS